MPERRRQTKISSANDGLLSGEDRQRYSSKASRLKKDFQKAKSKLPPEGVNFKATKQAPRQPDETNQVADSFLLDNVRIIGATDDKIGEQVEYNVPPDVLLEGVSKPRVNLHLPAVKLGGEQSFGSKVMGMGGFLHWKIGRFLSGQNPEIGYENMIERMPPWFDEVEAQILTTAKNVQKELQNRLGVEPGSIVRVAETSFTVGRTLPLLRTLQEDAETMAYLNKVWGGLGPFAKSVVTDHNMRIGGVRKDVAIERARQIFFNEVGENFQLFWGWFPKNYKLDRLDKMSVVEKAAVLAGGLQNFVFMKAGGRYKDIAESLGTKSGDVVARTTARTDVLEFWPMKPQVVKSALLGKVEELFNSRGPKHFADFFEMHPEQTAIMARLADSVIRRENGVKIVEVKTNLATAIPKADGGERRVVFNPKVPTPLQMRDLGHTVLTVASTLAAASTPELGIRNAFNLEADPAERRRAINKLVDLVGPGNNTGITFVRINAPWMDPKVGGLSRVKFLEQPEPEVSILEVGGEIPKKRLVRAMRDAYATVQEAMRENNS